MPVEHSLPRGADNSSRTEIILSISSLTVEVACNNIVAGDAQGHSCSLGSKSTFCRTNNEFKSYQHELSN